MSDPFSPARPPVRSDRHLAQAQAASRTESLGEVPANAADVVEWITAAGLEPEERERRADLAREAENQRSAKRVTVINALEDAYREAYAADPAPNEVEPGTT